MAAAATEGPSLDAVQAALTAHGYMADPAQTLREIAVANGFTKPTEVVELMRATPKYAHETSRSPAGEVRQKR